MGDRGAQGRRLGRLAGLGHPDKELDSNQEGIGSLYLWDKQERDMLSFAFWRMILEAAIEEWLEGAPLHLLSPHSLPQSHLTSQAIPLRTTTGPPRPSVSFLGYFNYPAPYLKTGFTVMLVPSQKTQPSQRSREGFITFPKQHLQELQNRRSCK